MRILVVDDEVELRESYVDFINLETEFEVDQCSNGEEAFVLCELINYDLIILDYRMPKMTGLQLINKLRAINNENCLTAIIFLSGFIDEINIDILPEEQILLKNKPIKPVALLELINNISSESRAVA